MAAGANSYVTRSRRHAARYPVPQSDNLLITIIELANAIVVIPSGQLCFVIR